MVSRLCAPIEGTDPMRIAECLGLDSSRFKGAAAAAGACAARGVIVSYGWKSAVVCL